MTCIGLTLKAVSIAFCDIVWPHRLVCRSIGNYISMDGSCVYFRQLLRIKLFSSLVVTELFTLENSDPDLPPIYLKVVKLSEMVTSVSRGTQRDPTDPPLNPNQPFPRS